MHEVQSIKYSGAKLLAQLADANKVTLSTCSQIPTHMIKRRNVGPSKQVENTTGKEYDSSVLLYSLLLRNITILYFWISKLTFIHYSDERRPGILVFIPMS
jgi:hypothetical protein